MWLLCYSTLYTLLVLAAGSAFAGTLVVDNDGADCPQADFNSIQTAVAAAQPGDKILVCPGVYAESVLINKADLRIEAQAAPGEVVLQGTPALDGFALQGASGVHLEGFTVQGFRRNILVQGGEGNTIRKNVTTLGVVPAPPVAGITGGAGIVVLTSSRNVVEHNVSFRNANVGIVAATQAADNTFRNNETFSNNVGILVQFAGTGNLVLKNDSYKNNVGIRINEMPQGAMVEHNRAFDNTTNGIAVVNNSSAVVVRNNNSARNGHNGIRINLATGNVVEKNDIDGNVLSGISLENGDGNTVQQNVSRKNGQDGIRADKDSTGNTIERNVMRANVEHDAHDDSASTGTGGTANLWTRNKCETENRPTLCENH